MLRHGIGQSAARVVKPALGLNTERDAVAGNKGEEPQNHERIASADGLLQIDASVHHRELFVRGAGAPVLERAVQGRALSGNLLQHLPRVPRSEENTSALP